MVLYRPQCSASARFNFFIKYECRSPSGTLSCRDVEKHDPKPNRIKSIRISKRKRMITGFVQHSSSRRRNATTLACERQTSEQLLTSTNGFRRRSSFVLYTEPSYPRHTQPRVLSAAMTDRSRDQPAANRGDAFSRRRAAAAALIVDV